MAAAKACPLPSYTPQEVAAVFVDRYYFLLRDFPGELHKFYLDSSMVSRLGPDGVMISFTTMEEIRKHVLSSLDCKEYEILSSDAQFTANEGVFVVVIGCFTTKNDEIRKFNQSFVLTPMERVNGYFVSNDILRFLDKQESKVVHTESIPTAVSTSTSDDEPTNAVPKKSFLSVVPAQNENNAPFKAPPMRKSINTAPQESNFDRKSGLEEKKNTRIVDNVEGTSIFVGNLATDSKPEELYEAFKSFGPIKRNGVQIRTDKEHRWYAFIQFESSCSAQIAIQASFIRIADRRLIIKEKKSNDSGNPKFSRDSMNGNGNCNGQDNFRSGSNFTRHNGPAN
ncbi:ras GTPase-activating protein-binding protein 2-like [Durio zibethinus]|uniref:Ras GTPase-activating protein-binding protein 2-like n=1 Tax=Durio zibethinus TaxID=66656 RepID=A0A6P6AHY5_DURZI|nr:ras GTPase-activating protein-binding protein 2-like [Durio zibethinus]